MKNLLYKIANFFKVNLSNSRVETQFQKTIVEFLFVLLETVNLQFGTSLQPKPTD